MITSGNLTPASPGTVSVADSVPASMFSNMTVNSVSTRAFTELKNVKRELYKTQHQMRLVKIDLERERFDRVQERNRLNEQIAQMQEKMQETEKDLQFISEAEAEAQEKLEKLRTSSTSTERELRAQILTLKTKLTEEQDARFAAEEQVSELLKELESFEIEDHSAEFEQEIENWKEKVTALQSKEQDYESRIHALETENDSLRQQVTAEAECPALYSTLISTFGGLQEAQEEVESKKREAARLADRIGSVMELEEKLRVATVELNRLKSESVLSKKSSPSNISLITAELNTVKQSLLESQVRTEFLEADLQAAKEALAKSQEAEKTLRSRVFELEARLKKQ